MWLSMLTADAAAQHGHEFSAPRPQNAQGLRFPIPRSPLTTFLPTARQRGNAGTASSMANGGPSAKRLVPKRSRSLRVTMAELKEEPEDLDEVANLVEEWGEDRFRNLRIPGAFVASASTIALAASKDNLKGEVVHNEELVAQRQPESTTSMEAPNVSPRRHDFVPLKRTPRTKTAYRLAHPPPPAKAKKHLRPKVLLQLQQQASTGFHRPSYEVLPACRFKNNTKIGTKLAKLRKLARRNDQLSSEDLVVVQVDEQRIGDLADDEVDPLDGRMDIAIVCAAEGGNAFIHLENSIWKASPGKNGVYDLALQGDEEQRARWFIPKAKRQRPASITGAEGLSSEDDKKLYFTAMQPNTTKHPTVAALTKQSIDIYDHFVRSTTDEPLGDAPADSILVDTALIDGEEGATSRQILPVDDALRQLIIASGSWLFFRQGWSPFFQYSPINILPSTISLEASFLQRTPLRSCSSPIETLRSMDSRPASRQESVTSTRQVLPRLIRAATSRSRSYRSRDSSPITPRAADAFPDSVPQDSTPRIRPLLLPTLSRRKQSSRPTTAPSPSRSQSTASRVSSASSEAEVIASIEEVIRQSPQPTRPQTPTKQMHHQHPSSRVSSSPADGSEPVTPAPYWQQYDALLVRDLHSPSPMPLLDLQRDGTNDKGYRIESTAIPNAATMRHVSPRPTSFIPERTFPQPARLERTGLRRQWQDFRHEVFGLNRWYRSPTSPTSAEQAQNPRQRARAATIAATNTQVTEAQPLRSAGTQPVQPRKPLHGMQRLEHQQSNLASAVQLSPNNRSGVFARLRPKSRRSTMVTDIQTLPSAPLSSEPTTTSATAESQLVDAGSMQHHVNVEETRRDRLRKRFGSFRAIMGLARA